MNKYQQLTKYLTHYLKSNIPLSNAIEVQDIVFDGNNLSFFAPLEPNINDKQTAFGGSLSSLAILCGWSFVHLHVVNNKLPYDIVISRAETDFLLPITTDFTAMCTKPSDIGWNKFIGRLAKGNRASVKLGVEIVDANQKLGAKLAATYVALPKS